MACGCGNSSQCSCVLSDGCGTTISGAGTTAQPYVVDGSSNIVLSDTVPDTDPPCSDYPGLALDPDTGLPVAYFVPDDGWTAVAGGAGGVEVYRGVGDPNTEIGDPGVSTAIYYDLGVPNAAGAAITTTYPYALWVWNDDGSAWEPYPRTIMAVVGATGSSTVSSANWTRLTSAPNETLDTAGMHSTSSQTGRIYTPYEGYYQVAGRVNFAAVTSKSAGTRRIRLRVNNTATAVGAIQYPVQGTSDEAAFPFFYPATFFNAGDFIEVEVYQDSGANLQVTLLQFSVELKIPVPPPVGP